MFYFEDNVILNHISRMLRILFFIIFFIKFNNTLETDSFNVEINKWKLLNAVQ